MARGSKPLSEPVLLILISLAHEPRHGYSLMKHIEELSGGRVSLSTGTLYGALRRLLEERSIEPIEGGDGSRDKQTYRLSAEGRQQLQAEVKRLENLARMAKSRSAPRRVKTHEPAF